MKITELKCTACGGTLKVDERNPHVAECEYCHTRYTLEGERGLVQQAPRIDYKPYTPKKAEKAGQEFQGRSRSAVLILLGVVLLGAMSSWVIFSGQQAKQQEETAMAAGALAGEENPGAFAYV